MDQRAQISIEYILLLAVVLVIVLIFSSIIFGENEQNNVASAVQLGASNGVAIISYTNTGSAPVKVTSVTMTNGVNNTYNLVVHLSGPVTNQTPIFNSIYTSLNNTLNSTTYNHTNDSHLNPIQTGTSLTWFTARPGSGNTYTYYITLG